jgi:hypothetical protein
MRPDNRSNSAVPIGVAAVLVLTFASPLLANPEPPPIIVDIAQEGADVTVELERWFEPYDTWEPVLLRHNPVTERMQVLLEDQELDPYGPWDCTGECPDPTDEAWCADNPGECADCDGDETPECPGMCDWVCLMSILDECVPPGAMRYAVYEWEGLECVQQEYVDFVVEDLGQDCPDGDLVEHDCYGAADGDSDSDGDGDSDSDIDDDVDDGCGGDYGPHGDEPSSDAGSCAVGGTGRSPATRVLLVLLLLGIGLAVLSSRP